VEKGGCGTCHDVHGSGGLKLLKKDVPDLCTGCHKADTPVFAKTHMGYPVGKARCTSCHDPHASSVAGMLSDNVHPPVARRSCAQCHEPPTSPTPFKTKSDGVDLCKTCHAPRIGQMVERNRLHRPVVEGKACLSCHSPHASRQPKLVKGNMVGVCGTCHADTIKRQDNASAKHPPMGRGQCTACHDPHAGDAPLLFVKTTSPDLCGKCHDWQRHSSHPVGEKYRDPRNQNLAVDCLSCHRAHGTEYEHMLPFRDTTATCVKCHERLKR
jgi:predicted CXXCH cytochrome family protein